jgi:transcriptional regulator with XRE-family HTH domain
MDLIQTVALGANVRAEMARRGDSQTDLGRVLGISQGSVSARLRGETPFKINELVTLVAYFDVPLARLLEGVAVG